MNTTQAVKMAFKSIMGSKLRSFLTMLGIIIGVSAVIALVSLGQGATSQVTAQVRSLGSNLLTVNITGRGAKTTLDYKDVIKLSEKSGIEALSPIISGNIKVKSGMKNVDVSIEGTNSAYETVRGFHVQEGRFLLPIDLEYR